MKRLVGVLLVFCVILSCIPFSSYASETTYREIVDSAGDHVVIPAEVHTVINLVTFGCQDMIDLGLGDYLIGMNEESVESPWMIEVYPRINEIPTYKMDASAETLLLADADIVFIEDAEMARALRKKGVPAITFMYYSIDEMKHAILMMGDILGTDASEKCKKYVEYLDANIALVASGLDGKLEKRESLYYINGVSNKGLYKTTGHGSTNWACAEYSYTNFATTTLLESPANRVDPEAILAINPENIIIGGVYQHVLYDELMQSPQWSTNKAVVDGNVFKVPMGISAWNRYGLEIALMIPWTSAVVYPELFDYDIVGETMSFYHDFVGYPLTEQEALLMLSGLTPEGEKSIAN